MAFHKDFNCRTSPAFVDYIRLDSGNAASLQPGRSYEIEFKANYGKIVISAAALDINDPWRETLVGGHIDPTDPAEGVGSTIESWNHVMLEVQLFSPDQSAAVASWRTVNGWDQQEEFLFEHTVTTTAPSRPGLWKCRMTNRGSKHSNAYIRVSHNFDRAPLVTRPIPRVLIDHAYQIILEALTPKAHINGRNLNIDFSSELLDYFGAAAAGILDPPAQQLPGGLQGTGSLEDFVLDASTGGQLQYAMDQEFRRRRDKWQKIIDTNPANSTQAMAARQKLTENEEWRAGWMERVEIDWPALHVHAAVAQLHLEREFDLLMFGSHTADIIDLVKGMIDLYICFDPQLTRAHVLVLLPDLDTGVLLDLLQDFGLAPDVHEELIKRIEPVVRDAGPLLGRYLGEAMGHLGGGDVVFHRLNADQINWVARYTRIPRETLAPPIDTGIDDDTPVIDGGPLTPGTPPAPGPMPPEFVLAKPPNAPSRPAFCTQQLDRIEHLVFLMMENRSFDHMLGYLGLPAGSTVEGVRGRHTNIVSGFTQPLELLPARDAVRDPITKIFDSPWHSFDHVTKHIANGAMSGFAQDFDDKHKGYGQYVMTYYTGEELETYDRLAREHTICDHWFAAFPGGTWPNRWSTLSGNTPELGNLELDDPRIGFLTGNTIFDTLTKFGIDWKVFESDLTLVRTYDKYRLDTNRILPFHNRYDPSRGFRETARAGQLPAVTFVEPNFRDIPPLSSANDDLAPADLRHGQNFIACVVDALRQSPKWSKTLLLITYDEHGGFYDHVPPPGTELGPPEWIGKVPPLLNTTQKCDYMGVRVPAIVVSPLAARGGVCKQVFDHCSIIKTILLRHRAKFPTAVFTQFGARVNMAADLGLALAASAPPIETSYVPLPQRIATASFPSRARGAAPPPPAAPVKNDFHQSLLRGFLPRRKPRQLPTTPASGTITPRR